jgi:multidrug efflux pump subunit AcrB
VRRAISWFAENHVAANLMMVLFVIGGIAALVTVPIKTFPDIEADLVTVAVPYRGAAPQEVEEGVCVRIEEEIEGIDGIERLTSSSNEGACAVTAELIAGANKARVLGEIKNQVDAIDTFPEETDKPIVSQPVMRRPVIDVAISGNIGERSLKELGEQLREEITLLPGITQAELTNTRPYEVSIEVPEAALRRHGLTFDDVVRAVRRSSLDLPGGSIKAQGGEILLRSKGQAYLGVDFERIVLMTSRDGTRVLLGDVARVRDDFEDIDQAAQFNGAPAAVVRVFRVGDQDSLGIASTVRAFVAERQADLPEGVALTVWRDSTIMLKGRLDILLRNGRTGFILVFALLALFLRLRLAFWVAFGVPISFAGAIWMFPVLDLAIDSISLFSFILVLGILVDDAIVVGESCYTEQQRTGNRLQGAISGTLAVAIPVIFGVLTTIVAFTPMLLVPGPMGQIFYAISLVVVLCLIFSLIESQLILPAHLGHGSAPTESGEQQGWWRRVQGSCARGLERFIGEVYHPFLERALEWRYTTLGAGVATLLITLGVVASNRLPFTFFPAVEGDYISAQLTMPTGAPVESTQAAVDHIYRSLARVAERLEPTPEGQSVLRHVFSAVGDQPFASGSGPPVPGRESRGGSHLAEVTVELIPGEERDISTAEVAQRWREETGQIPDAVELAFSSDLFSAGTDVDVQLQGPNIDHLREAATRLKAELMQYPGVLDVADSFRSGKEEVKLSVLATAEPLGVSLEDLARQVRQAFYGEEAQRIQRGRDDVRVMVRYPKDERRSLGSLEDMRIRTPEGFEVPFAVVARAERGRGFSTIKRAERQRVVNVTARVDTGRTTGGEVLAALQAGALPEILNDYRGMSFSLWGVQREQTRAFGSLVRWYAIALFGIYGLLAIPLRSYAQPLIVMTVIPFGLVGAVAGHLLLGISNLSFMSVMGFVALSGVVVNASLVLVHAVNSKRAEGASVQSAVTDAALLRFRPIFLTSITTFAGLAPLMSETSLQAQFLIPMAVSLAFGVVFSTAVTLLIVPSLYLILEDIKELPGRLRGHRTAAASLAPAPALPSPSARPAARSALRQVP